MRSDRTWGEQATGVGKGSALAGDGGARYDSPPRPNGESKTRSMSFALLVLLLGGGAASGQGQSVALETVRCHVLAVAFSPDGKRMAAGMHQDPPIRGRPRDCGVGPTSR